MFVNFSQHGIASATADLRKNTSNHHESVEVLADNAALLFRSRSFAMKDLQISVIKAFVS